VATAAEGPVVRCGNGYLVLRRFTIDGFDEVQSRQALMQTPQGTFAR
jgi:hypothetical protein